MASQQLAQLEEAEEVRQTHSLRAAVHLDRCRPACCVVSPVTWWWWVTWMVRGAAHSPRDGARRICGRYARGRGRRETRGSAQRSVPTPQRAPPSHLTTHARAWSIAAATHCSSLRCAVHQAVRRSRALWKMHGVYSSSLLMPCHPRAVRTRIGTHT